MNKNQRRTLLIVLAILLLVFPTMLVAAKELNYLTISGPGIKNELTLKDPEDMMKLQESGFFDAPLNAKIPENLGEGYTVTAHLNMDGQIVPFVEMVYYPAEEGEQGYINVTGRFNGESVSVVNEWGKIRPQSETVLRGLIATTGIAIQPAVPAVVVSAPVVEQQAEAASVPVTSPARAETSWLILAGILLTTLVAAFALRNRTFSQREAKVKG